MKKLLKKSVVAVAPIAGAVALVLAVAFGLRAPMPLEAQAQGRSANGSLTTQFSVTCAATSCITLPAGNYSRVGVQITGTWMGTMSFKCSLDGTNYVATNFTPYASATDASTATGNGAWSKAITAQSCRAEFTTASSGTAVVTMRGT